MAQKRKAVQKENNFALISKLLSDSEIPVKKVNWDWLNLLYLKGTLAYWLKFFFDRACTLLN